MQQDPILIQHPNGVSQSMPTAEFGLKLVFAPVVTMVTLSSIKRNAEYQNLKFNQFIQTPLLIQT